MSIIAAPIIEGTKAFSFSTEEIPEVVAIVANADLTVAQAANYLRTTEKHLNRLLDLERIPFRWENGERLISQSNLLEYETYKERRHTALDELFCMFREAGMSDDYDD